MDHGELRFEAYENQERWGGVVTNCLKAFTPWSTQGYCGQYASLNGNSKLKSLEDAADQNQSEVRSCHILIEPTCYERLMEELAFDAPNTKLAVPRFAMPEKHENDDTSTQPPRAPELSQDDFDQIKRRLTMTDARRRNMNPRIVTIVVDGVEHTQLDLRQKPQAQIALESAASLVEIRGKDELGELPLATHVISYANNAFESSKATMKLSSGKLKFEVTPLATPLRGTPRAMLSLNYRAGFQWAHPWNSLNEVTSLRPTIRAYAVVGLAMALIGWAVAGAFYSRKVKMMEHKLLADRDQRQLMPAAARAIISYTLTRDDQRVRSADPAVIPEISLRFNSPAISLELPLAPTTDVGGYNAELKTFTGDQTLMTQSSLQPTGTTEGSIVEFVVPTDLLKADTYYTVYLHASDRTDRFTFRVVGNQ